MNVVDPSHYQATFEANKPHFPGANLPWVNTLREQALAEFIAQGFPTKKNEAWKYTPLNKLTQTNFNPTPKNLTENIASPPAGEAAEGGRGGQNKIHRRSLCTSHLNTIDLVFIDGHYRPEHSQGLEHLNGAHLKPLSEALNEFPDRLKPYLKTETQNHPFTALNTAHMQNGACLILPKDCQVDPVIHFIYLGQTDKAANTIRNLILAEQNSKATIIETYQGDTGQTYFTNALTQLYLEDNAQIEHYKIQQESLDAIHIGEVHVAQAANSHFKSYSFAFGGALVRSDTTVDFNAPGASAALYGLYVPKGHQHIDHHTTLSHLTPNCQSVEHYRGVLEDNARAVFNGKVFIAEKATGSNTDQINKNLLLSKRAEVNTKPQLEIYNDDVRATHGATVGQLDPAALFYCQARGIPKAHAEDLLIHAFTETLLDEVHIPELKAALLTTLNEKLQEEHHG